MKPDDKKILEEAEQAFASSLKLKNPPIEETKNTKLSGSYYKSEKRTLNGDLQDAISSNDPKELESFIIQNLYILDSNPAQAMLLNAKNEIEPTKNNEKIIETLEKHIKIFEDAKEKDQLLREETELTHKILEKQLEQQREEGLRR